MQKDFEYSFTECDEYQGRWRVSVPKKPGTCTGGNPNAPVRVGSCFMACSPGSFYDPSSLTCNPCPVGSYSIGGGIKVTQFNSSTLEKNGISIKTQSVYSRVLSDHCEGWSMKPSGLIEVKPLSMSGSTCQSVVTMNVRIVKKGNLRFTYQYIHPSDSESTLVFSFHHRNSEDVISKASFSADIADIDTFDVKFPRETAGYSSSRWSNFDVPLQPGYYTFIWRSLVIGSDFSRDVFGSFSKEANDDDVQNSIRQKRFSPLDTSSSSSSSTTSIQGFIRIKSIEIYGTAFASDCTPCDEGFFSNVTGSKNCLPCPVNTFSSGKGSITCSACDSTSSYSPLGSTACIKRPICGMDDVYVVKSNCNENKQTSTYKWIEPRVCHDVNNSLLSRLKPSINPCNASSSLQSDRECSPGMELVSGKCSLCRPNYYNDGSLTRCEQCPPSSLPLYELVLNTWKNDMDPMVKNLIAFDCFSTLDPSSTFNDCKGNVDPWKVIPSTEGSYIRSSEAPIDSILTLTLTIPGFRHSSGGQLMFTFSLIGSDSSMQLYESKGKMSRQIGSWIASSSSNIGHESLSEGEGVIRVKEDEKVVFRHSIRENVPVSFTWIYQRSQLVQSHVKLYSISVTNPTISGAISCSSCTTLESVRRRTNHDDDDKGNGIGSDIKDTTKISDWNWRTNNERDEESKCIPCPSGQYLNVEGKETRRENLVTFTSHSSSSSSSPFDTRTLEQGRQHESIPNGSDNLFIEQSEVMVKQVKREMGKSQEVKKVSVTGSKLTQLNAECLKCPSGTIINSTLSFPKGRKESCISCGTGLVSNDDGTDCIADCNKLIVQGGDEYNLSVLKYPLTFQANHLFTSSGMKYFHSFNISLCGSQVSNLCTNNATSPKFSTSISPTTGFIDTSFPSLVCRSTMIPDGDDNVFSTQSVSLANKLRGISRETHFMDQQVIDQFTRVKSDLHFYFEPTSPTMSCKKGRSMIVTLRCDPTVPTDTPIISAPSSCPLGTCDGCSFNLLVRSNSSAACRKCQENDYDTVIGECINGEQKVHFINPKNCIIDMKSKKSVSKRKCSILPRSVELFLSFVSFFAFIMSVLLIYCWKKNQKLEYNYSKLVENTQTSESCMEDDEVDGYDDEGHEQRRDSLATAAAVNEGKSEHQSLRQKIISSRNEIDYSGYETIQLTKHMQEDIC